MIQSTCVVRLRQLDLVIEALAEPEPEPVVWIRHENEWVGLAPKERLPIETPKPDVSKPLTEEQINTLWVNQGSSKISFARAIERAHGIKPTEENT